MITINDNDLPITVAEKLIKGTRPNNPSSVMKALAQAITGDSAASETVDMFDVDELKEIANYLIIYYESHKNGD